MRVWLEEQEITGLCVQAVVDKNIDGAGAEARLRLVCAPENGALPRINPACGQWIVLTEAGETVFSGGVERISFDASARMLTAECFDPASTLATRKIVGGYEGMPEEIAKRLCRECGLETGQVDAYPEKRYLASAGVKSAFQIIRAAYDGQCVTDYENGRLNIFLRGEIGRTPEMGRLRGLTARNAFSEETGEAIREARATFAGNVEARCGQAIRIDRPTLGVYGAYLVTQVRKKWEKGLMTTELGLVSI